MRRLASAILVLALSAGTAAAERVLVIKTNATRGTETVRGLERMLATTTSVLEALGCEYDVVSQDVVRATTTGPAENVGQAALKTGLVRFGVGTGSYTRQYGLIIHQNFDPNGGGSNWMAGHRPDTLTLRTGVAGGTTPQWPEIPQVFLGATAVTGGSLYSNVSTCTTGVKAAGGMSTFPSHANDLSMQAVGTEYRWKESFNSAGTVYYRNSTTTGLAIDRATRDRIVRSRVIVGGSSANTSLNIKGSVGEAWPDSMSTPAHGEETPLADTALIYTQERFIGDSAVMVFCLAGTFVNSSLQLPAMEIAMAVALADSAAGGTIIGQRADWHPVEVGFVVSGAFTRSVSNASDEQWNTHGTQLSDINDSSFVKAGIDSLARLNIPIVVSVNIDSVGAFPYEKAWWRQIPTARFTPESRIGTASTLVGAAVNANAYNSPDVFGYKRERALITDDKYNGVGAYADGDTTVSGLLYRSRIRLDSIPEFKGRLSTTLVAPWGDYIPRQYSKRTMPSRDTLVMAFHRAGFRAGVIPIIPPGSMSSGSSFNSAGGFIAQDAQAPYVPAHSVGTVYRNKDGLGEFRWLGARHMDEANTAFFISHPISSEALLGVVQAPWYPDDLTQWAHQFKTKLHVLILRPGELAFRATSSSNVSMRGVHEWRWVVSQMRTVNLFAHASHKPFRFVYPEDIEP